MSLYLHSVHKSIFTIGRIEVNIAERNYVVVKFLTISLSASVPAKTSRKIGNESKLYALFAYIIQKSKLFRNIFLYSEEHYSAITFLRYSVTAVV